MKTIIYMQTHIDMCVSLQEYLCLCAYFHQGHGFVLRDDIVGKKIYTHIYIQTHIAMLCVFVCVYKNVCICLYFHKGHAFVLW